MSIQNEILNLRGSWQFQSFSIKLQTFAQCTISRRRWYFSLFYVIYIKWTLDLLPFSVYQQELYSALYASVFTIRIGSGLKKEIIITIIKKYQKFNTDPREPKYKHVYLFYPCNQYFCAGMIGKCPFIMLLLTGMAQGALSEQLFRQTFMHLKKQGCLFCFGK